MQTYSEMVDSELAYLGMIPRSWRLTPASMLFNENRQNNQSLISQTPLQFKMGNIIRKNVDVDDKLREEIKRYTVVDKNDIMVNGLNLNYDFATQRVALVGESGCITPAYIALRTRENYLPRYANYLLKALDGQKVLNGWGTGIRLTLNFTEFKKYRLPEPNTETQEKIADFLDTETAQIDNLIAKQERLLELLEEKRRATITHAVTRGLNPSVELKETNIPWLSQIPVDWKTKRIKDLFSANDEALSQKTLPDTEFEYVDISSVDKYRGITKREPMTFENSPSRARRIVQQGDIILGAVRTYLEAIAQITEDEQSVIVSTGFVVLRPKQLNDSDFYYYAFRAGSFMANVVANSDGVSYPAINADKLMSLHIAVPPEDDRRVIAQFCREEMKQMDALKQKIQTQISLLRERRTSLISHVVTGKIKI